MAVFWSLPSHILGVIKSGSLRQRLGKPPQLSVLRVREVTTKLCNIGLFYVPNEQSEELFEFTSSGFHTNKGLFTL